MTSFFKFYFFVVVYLNCNLICKQKQSFKWELKIIYDSSLDNVSMSSVHSTDLSDF